MVLNDKQFRFRYRNMENVHCRICGEYVSTWENEDFAYIKTKRRSEFLVHKHCMNTKKISIKEE